MSLVVQGLDVDNLALKSLAKLTRSSAIEQISLQSFRLCNAQYDPCVPTLCAQAQLDYAWVAAERRLSDFGLFVTDMDSTLINIERIDEIADMQGLKTQVAEITEAAMRGDVPGLVKASW